MCARFLLYAPTDELVLRFGLRVPPPLPNAAEIRPTDMALAIPPDRATRLMRFGLSVDWQRAPVINARAETVFDKPTFRPHLARPVLVPASAYVEWRTEGKAKHLNRIRPADGGVFALAGLADGDGRFCLMTCAPAPAVAAIHHRMPVILPDPEAEAAWLAGPRPDLLRPYPGPLTAEEETPPAPVQGALF